MVELPTGVADATQPENKRPFEQAHASARLRRVGGQAETEQHRYRQPGQRFDQVCKHYRVACDRILKPEVQYGSVAGLLFSTAASAPVLAEACGSNGRK